MMEPLMDLLCSHFTVVAPDTPGYGYSDPLPARPQQIADYLPCLHALITSFTSEPVFMYGTATGAQLAIGYSLQYAHKIRYLFLDNCAHFEEEERESLLKNYFPDFTPAADGSHLQKLWQHLCDSCLYFPWYQQDEEHRIATELPPAAVLQSMMNDYLHAGVHYADGYKAAFGQEHKKYLQQLRCPATLFQWLGSPLRQYAARITAAGFNNGLRIVETPVAIAERYARMKQEMVLSLTHNQQQ
jgi:pimeloyl-ACP methyl ester carboxylesterase